MRRRLRSHIALLALALTATIASVTIQRVGPTRLVEGEGFCPGMAPCRIPALGGGFPLPWLVDEPQVSVPNQLSVFEDHLYPGNFLVDLALWLALIQISRGLRRRYRSRGSRTRKRPRPGGGRGLFRLLACRADQPRSGTTYGAR